VDSGGGQWSVVSVHCGPADSEQWGKWSKATTRKARERVSNGPQAKQ
jgi:hypothetical protein